MKVEHLITMANQIGTFFESMPDRDEAVNGIADHIRRFWEPRMRRTLLAALDDTDGDARTLLPIVHDALVTHRTALQPLASAAPSA